MTRTENVYSLETIERLENLVLENNKNCRDFYSADRYFIVDLTGAHQVYFTLYRWTKPLSGHVNPYTFIKNLSTNLEEAVNIVLGISRRTKVPVLLITNDNNNPLVTNFKSRTKEGIPTVPFGKYRGKTIPEIWDLDRNYVMWFLKNYKTSDYKDFRGRMVEPKLTDADQLMIESAKDLIDLFFEAIAVKNRETSESQYVGEIGKRMEIFNCIVVKAAPVESGSNINKVILTDQNMNRIQIYDNTGKLKVSDVLNVIGTPARHFEVLGIKTTYLNRIKIS